MRVTLRTRESEPVCAVCRDGADLTVCHRCGVTTHLECFADVGRCPTLGCVEPPENNLGRLLEEQRERERREVALAEARRQYEEIARRQNVHGVPPSVLDREAHAILAQAGELTHDEVLARHARRHGLPTPRRPDRWELLAAAAFTLLVAFGWWQSGRVVGWW